MGVHYCVPRLQNNSEPVEMMGGSLLCPQDFGVSFSVCFRLFLFFNLFHFFKFHFFKFLKFHFFEKKQFSFYFSKLLF